MSRRQNPDGDDPVKITVVPKSSVVLKLVAARVGEQPSKAARLQHFFLALLSCLDAAYFQAMPDLVGSSARAMATAYGLLGAVVGAVEGVVHSVNGDYMVQRAFADTIAYKRYSKTIRPLQIAAPDKEVCFLPQYI